MDADRGLRGSVGVSGEMAGDADDGGGAIAVLNLAGNESCTSLNEAAIPQRITGKWRL